jgi:DNA-binding Lrp family transcriptional regulator
MPVAFVLINTEIGKVDEVLQRLLEVDEVKEAFSVAGPYSLIARVETDSFDRLVKVIPQRIHTISGISSTLTLIAFGLAKEYRTEACEQALALAKSGRYRDLYQRCRACKQLKNCEYGTRTVTYGI